MTALFILGWIAAGLLAAFLLARADVRSDGFVTRGAVIFYSILAVFGPAALAVAFIVAGVSLLQSGAFNEPFWTRNDDQ
jgi:hypothetical protein